MYIANKLGDKLKRRVLSSDSGPMTILTLLGSRALNIPSPSLYTYRQLIHHLTAYPGQIRACRMEREHTED